MNASTSDTSPADNQPGAIAREGGLHGRVLDLVGHAILSGTLPSGTVLTIEGLEKRYSVSRSVAREAVRVVESMGLVASRRRVGVVVLPQEAWNVFDPRVIRWRLGGAERPVQLRSLTELRIAVEPDAAGLAATRASLAQASELVGLSGKLWAAGQSGDLIGFLELDIAFHQLILLSSGNEMFQHLGSIVAEVLSGRTKHGLMPDRPHIEALQLHVEVANAIQRGDPPAANAAMLRIVQRTLSEMCYIWDPPDTDASA